MRNAIITTVILLMSFGALIAQQQTAQGSSQPLQEKTDLANQVIKPTFVVGDLVFAVNSMNSVKIQGKEVDAFLQVKEHFKPYLQKIQDQKMEIDQEIETEVPVGIANNMLIFLQRIELQGANAERYQRFKKTMIDAAKSLQQ